MTDFVLLNHLLNFLAPALWLALLLPLAGRFFFKKHKTKPELGVQVAINFAVNMLALGFGLWFFGRDGKMASYVGMTLACASSQWLMLRGRR